MLSAVRQKYEHTIYACYIGYITQAIVNNFAPLLFLTFVSDYGLSLDKITMITTVNFLVQLVVDLVSARVIDRVGYRRAVMFAHLMAAVGLIGMAVLPGLLGDAYAGILISVVCYAIGGGIIEVLISPIVEACPTSKKEGAMSLLHSFYCWGHVGVVLLSSLFFAVFGTDKWQILAVVWALVPALNSLLFTRVPIYSLTEEGDRGIPLSGLVKRKTFWVIMLLMLCAGASEQAVSQWASTFAESELHIAKAVGDLAGPMFFAVLMGTSRAFYGKYGSRINLEKFMGGSILLCMISYFLISLSPWPVLSLLGCGLCGFSVGILWPGTFSKAAAAIKGGGTAMFAFFALAGDLGCSAGPTLAGFVSSHFGNNLRAGILAAIIFPLLLIVGMVLSRKVKQ